MITTADARQWLGVDSSNDQVLARMIAEATATVGRELGRYLGPVAQQVEISSGGDHYPGRSVIFLDYDPVVSEDTPMAVATRGSAFDPFVDLAADDWALNGREVLARGTFPMGRGTVRATYYAGVTVGEGPGELADLVRQLVVIRWNTKGGPGVSPLMRSETLGDYSYTRGDLEALANWNAICLRWRRRLP